MPPILASTGNAAANSMVDRLKAGGGAIDTVVVPLGPNTLHLHVGISRQEQACLTMYAALLQGRQGLLQAGVLDEIADTAVLAAQAIYAAMRRDDDAQNARAQAVADVEAAKGRAGETPIILPGG